MMQKTMLSRGLAKIAKARKKGKYKPVKFPNIQRVTKAEDLDNLVFTEDMAEIEVPIEHIDVLPFKNEDRADSSRLRSVERQIRYYGYNNFDPVIVRLGRRGRWVIVDGGHRVTAARKVSKEFFTNLFEKKVHSIHFTLFRTPLSNTRLGWDEDDKGPGTPSEDPVAAS